MKSKDPHVPLIFGALVIAILPYLFWLSFWIFSWCMILWTYEFQISRGVWPGPKAWVRQLLIIVGLLAVLLLFEGKLSGETFVGMLAIMASLKPMEIRSHRDKMVTLFLSYFIILTHLLFNDTLLLAFHMLISVCTTTAVLISLNYQTVRLSRHLKLSAMILTQALPLVIALFFLFPRAQWQIWGSRKLAVAKTGFSESLAPGDFSRIARDNSVAFRADFRGAVPGSDRLYWRGIVYWVYADNHWQRGQGIPWRQTFISGADAVDYTISLEPHGEKWWFSLDLPFFVSRYVRFFDDFTLASRRRLGNRLIYSVRSYMTYQTGPLKTWESIALALPPDENPQARQMARKWLDRKMTPEEIVAAALSFFKQGGFAYTLNPEPLKGDIVDDFLFRTRQGYCEHFASAFAFLMRAADVPARIVGGYLGGERNPFGDYLIVRQSDAHVWVEVWQPRKGWVRVDPTSAVSPQRISIGAAAALPATEQPFYLSSPVLAKMYRYWKPVQFAWDRMNSGWNLWVVGYSSSDRRQLLTGLGIKGSRWQIVFYSAIAVLLSFGLGILMWFVVRRFSKARGADPVLKAYALFCRKLAAVGIVRKLSQGPVDFLTHILTQRKDLYDAAKVITGLYIRLKYGTGASETDARQLQLLVRHFKPNKVPAGKFR